VDDEALSLLDRDQAAARLHVSRRTVIRYGQAGLLDERRIGPKLVRVTEASVEALKRKDDAA
jgi:predicted site-specific integrase-resolvase